ncbi:phytanoyl-CoA dioxygenase family protein [Pseudoalteromonas luteoviolacea]
MLLLAQEYEVQIKLAHSKYMTQLAAHLLGRKAYLVRAILFNKSASNNWAVPWHQDKTVSVSQQFFMKGWRSWSIKEGVHHAQPSIDFLNQMVTLRLHLNDTDRKNGCLKVIPASHQLGLLSVGAIKTCVEKQSAFNCKMSTGGLLAMRPRLLHCSEKLLSPSQRSVVHLEYSCFELPMGIFWA